MKTRKYGVLAAGCVLAAAVAAPALAGTEYDIEVTDHVKSRVEMIKIQAEGDNLRIELEKRGRRDQGGALIFQGDRREGKEPRLIVVDRAGGHVVLSQAKIAATSTSTPTAPEQPSPVVTEQMIESARLTASRIQDPEARQRALDEVNRRYGPPADADAEAPATLEYVERGVRTQHGYPCVRYDVLRNGQKVREIWATDWANIEGGRQTAKAFAAFGELYSELGESAEMDALREDNGFESIFELGRFPVVTEDYEDGKLVRTAVLKNARKVDHAPSVFRPELKSISQPIGD